MVCPDCGAAMTEQPREPRGTPTGGQFSHGQRRGANVALAPLDGSFLFPPPMRTAEEIIDFWSRVEIPDEALARMQRVYRDSRESLLRDWPAAAWFWYAKWVWHEQNPSPPDGANPGEIADWEGRARSAQADYEDRVRARVQDLPEELDRRDVRPLFRATAMLHTASRDADIAWPERRTVAEHRIEFGDGPRSVADATVETGTIGFSAGFVLPENYDADGDGVIDRPDFDWDKHRKIVNDAVIAAALVQYGATQQALDRQNEQLDGAFDEIYGAQQVVAQTVVDVNDTGKKKRRKWRDL